MIDSGEIDNIMPTNVMRELGLSLDTPFGKLYAMDKDWFLWW